MKKLFEKVKNWWKDQWMEVVSWLTVFFGTFGLITIIGMIAGAIMGKELAWVSKKK